nr:hypothetical protein [Tanacetum cinerariifolium]
MGSFVLNVQSVTRRVTTDAMKPQSVAANIVPTQDSWLGGEIQVSCPCPASDTRSVIRRIAVHDMETQKVATNTVRTRGEILTLFSAIDKGKKSKEQVFTVNQYHDGVFIAKPLSYIKGKPLTKGIKELKDGIHINDFLLLGYENHMIGDLYAEYYDYGVLEFLLEEIDEPNNDGESSDEYCSSDESEDFDGVDKQNEGEHNVVIKNLTTTNPFLNLYQWWEF